MPAVHRPAPDAIALLAAQCMCVMQAQLCAQQRGQAQAPLAARGAPCGQLHHETLPYAARAVPRPGGGAAGGGRLGAHARLPGQQLRAGAGAGAAREAGWVRVLPLVRVGRQCSFRGARCRPQGFRRLWTEADRQRFGHLLCVQHHGQSAAGLIPALLQVNLARHCTALPCCLVLQPAKCAALAGLQADQYVAELSRPGALTAGAPGLAQAAAHACALTGMPAWPGMHLLDPRQEPRFL